MIWHPIINQTDSLEAPVVRLCETPQLWRWCALRMGVEFPALNQHFRITKQWGVSATNMHVWRKSKQDSLLCNKVIKCYFVFNHCIGISSAFWRSLILPGFLPDPQLRALCRAAGNPDPFLFSDCSLCSCCWHVILSFLPGCHLLILSHCCINNLSCRQSELVWEQWPE